MRSAHIRSAVAVLLMIGATLSVGCRDDSSPDVVRIGVLAPFHTTPGEGIRNGVKMAVDEINASGGIDGRQIEVIEVNDEFSAAKALNGYKRLASSDDVVAVIGFAGSGIFPVMEQLERYEVPVLGTGVGADRLTQMVAEDPGKYGRFFRVMHRSSELADVTSRFLDEFLHGELGLKRFGILVEDDIWTKQLRDAWKARIEADPTMQLVFEETFSSETTDFGGVFNRMLAADAQYVLDASSQVPSALYLKRWAEFKGPLIGAVPTGAGTRKYYEAVGPGGTGVCTVGIIPSENNPLTERAGEWNEAYTKRSGDPEYTSAYSYDAVYILKEALERIGNGEQDLVSALEATDHTGVMGRYEFGPGHHPKSGKGHRVINMLQYQEPDANGYRVIWPADRAVAKFRPPEWWTADKPE